MKVQKPIIAGLISLATLTPCKAQRSARFFSETGITGVINKDALYYTGMNFEMPAEKNYSDVFGGMLLNSNKQVSFIGLALNNYNWTKNISSWVREVFTVSERGINSTLEVSPLRANAKAGNFSFSFNPAYTLYNDFKAGNTTQGVNTVFQTTYSMTPRDKFFAEAKYTSEPTENLLKTHFGKLKNNISFMLALMHTF